MNGVTSLVHVPAEPVSLWYSYHAVAVAVGPRRLVLALGAAAEREVERLEDVVGVARRRLGVDDSSRWSRASPRSRRRRAAWPGPCCTLQLTVTSSAPVVVHGDADATAGRGRLARRRRSTPVAASGRGSDDGPDLHDVWSFRFVLHRPFRRGRTGDAPATLAIRRDGTRRVAIGPRFGKTRRRRTCGLGLQVGVPVGGSRHATPGPARSRRAAGTSGRKPPACAGARAPRPAARPSARSRRGCAAAPSGGARS